MKIYDFHRICSPVLVPNDWNTLRADLQEFIYG